MEWSLNTGQKRFRWWKNPLSVDYSRDRSANNNAAAERAQAPSPFRPQAGRMTTAPWRKVPRRVLHLRPTASLPRRHHADEEPATRQTEPSRRNEDARTPGRSRAKDVERPSTPRPSTPRTETPSPARRENGGHNAQVLAVMSRGKKPGPFAALKNARPDTPPSRSNESTTCASASEVARPPARRALRSPVSLKRRCPFGGGGSTRSSSGGGATRSSGGRN
jgi:hypothetical protein